jgi:hypothetical protein
VFAAVPSGIAEHANSTIAYERRRAGAGVPAHGFAARRACSMMVFPEKSM